MEPVLIMKTACVLLALAALGGLLMAGILIAAADGTFLNLNYHWKMLPLPKGIIVGHAGLAILGFALLLAATWTATR